LAEPAEVVAAPSRLSFHAAADPVHALGSNVLGSIVGGAIEYTSLITGLRFLIILMAAVYGASAVRARR
jgi:hypothetical protein